MRRRGEVRRSVRETRDTFTMFEDKGLDTCRSSERQQRLEPGWNTGCPPPPAPQQPPSFISHNLGKVSTITPHHLITLLYNSSNI